MPLVRDDNRVPMDGSNLVDALTTVHVLAGVPKEIVGFNHSRRTLMVGNPHATLFVRLAMSSGTGLGESVWSLSIQPQGSVTIDGAYAQGAWWAYCYEAIDLPYQVG
jgi:hypothetical protein